MSEIKIISRELIEKAKNGDVSATEELIEICYPKIFAAARLIAGNKDDAEDITQEVFIKLFNNISNLKNVDAFGAWIRIITINECKVFFKKNNKKSDSFDDDPELMNKINTDEFECISEVPHENMDQNENDRLLLEVINSLPEKYSRILILRYYGDMSYQEIADVLEISIGSVKSRLNSAKLKLKSEIFLYEKKHGITLHTGGIFGNIGEIIRQAFSNAYLVSNTVSSSAAAVTNIASTGISTAVSTTISHAAARISAITAAVSVAACIGITAVNFNTDSLRHEVLPLSDSSVSSEEPDEPVQENAQNETSEAESSIASQPSDNTELQTASQPEPSTIVQISTVYVYQEPSVVSSPPETITERVIEYRDRDRIHERIVEQSVDPSIIYRDRIDERIVEQSVEPSIIYIEREASPQAQTAPAANNLEKDYSGSLIGEGGGYTFRIYPNAKEVTLLTLNDDFSGDMENLVLPSECTYDGVNYPVTRMQRNLITKNTSGESIAKLRSVQLPEYLTEIPDKIFSNSYSHIYPNLEEIRGGKYVTKIGSEAFYGTKLKEIDFPKQFPNVMEIGEGAFADCKELTTVVLPKDCIELNARSVFKNTLKLSDVTLYSDTLIGRSGVEGNYTADLGYPFSWDKYHLIAAPDEETGEFNIQFKPENALLSVNDDRESSYYYSKNSSKIKNVYIEFDEGVKLTDKKEYYLKLDNKFPVENLYVPEGITAFKAGIFNVKKLYLPSSMTDFDVEAMNLTFYDDIYISLKGRSEDEIAALYEKLEGLEPYNLVYDTDDMLHYHTVIEYIGDDSEYDPDEERRKYRQYYGEEYPYDI